MLVTFAPRSPGRPCPEQPAGRGEQEYPVRSLPWPHGNGRLEHPHAGHDNGLMAPDPGGCTKRVDPDTQGQSRHLCERPPLSRTPAAGRGWYQRRGAAGRSYRAVTDPAREHRTSKITSGCVGPEIVEHGFHRAVIAEVALAEETEHAYPGRRRQPGGCVSGPDRGEVTTFRPARPRSRELSRLALVGQRTADPSIGTRCLGTTLLTARSTIHCVRLR